jgi:predicted ATPase/class 3 adenylate cyclase
VIACPRCGHPNGENARYCSNCALALEPAEAGTEVRKTVTVMFMDVVGSTGIAERADPESLRRAMTRYFDTIGTVIERHGGTVEKYIGDAVMAVFGVPSVHEDDALRAVRAALEIRARLGEVDAEVRRERGISVAWRTGINTGEVVAGDAGQGQRFVTGDAVNVAARLEQAADPGEILLGATTHRLVRDEVRCGPAAAVEARGKSAPIRAYRLLSAGRARGDGRRFESPMVGRQRQQRQLAEAYDQVIADRVCHLFTIMGAAGVGKSRLVREFLSSLGEAAIVLHGRCLSYGDGITYWPIVEMIRQAADLNDMDDDAALVAKIGALVDDEGERSAVVERVAAVLGRAAPGGSVVEETFWAVRRLFESLARRRALVLVFDDLHWAEPTLLDLVEHLADWMRDAPALVICLARRELLDARPGWAGGKRFATTLTLEPLDESESGQLIDNLLGRVDLGSSLLARIAATAEGNPLFVEEMIGMLIDGGYLARTQDGWSAVRDVGAVSVPPTIQALLAARLDQLTARERAVIERGAVEGKVFHRSAVVELAPTALRDAVPTSLRSLARKELVNPDKSEPSGDETYRFRHLLIRDAAYAAVPKEARADLHARFAAWLERAAGEHMAEYDEIIAYHLEQAYRYRVDLGPADDEARRLARAAAEHLIAAGRRALERGDARAAEKQLTGALELLPEHSHERHMVVAELGDALAILGEWQRASELLRPALAAAETDGDDLGRALIELSLMQTRAVLNEVTIDEAMAGYQALLEVLRQHGDDKGVQRAEFQIALQHFYAGRAKAAIDLLMQSLADFAPGQASHEVLEALAMPLYWGPVAVQEVRAMAGTLMDPHLGRAIEAIQLRLLGGISGLTGDFDSARSLLEQSVAAELELGRQHLAYSTAGQWLTPLEALAGNYERAEQLMLDAYARMTIAGDLTFASTNAGHMAHVYVEMGRFDEAERYARIALDTSPADDVESQSLGQSARGLVLAARGEHATAEAAARKAAAIMATTDYLVNRANRLVNLADVLSAAGKQVEAAPVLRRALADYTAKGATFLVDRTRQRLARLEQRSAD